MIHYNVWFRFKDDIREADGLAAMRTFLADLHASGDVASYQILKNSGAAPKSRMLPFHALIVFQDDAQFSTAFASQSVRGIHTGLHGRMLSFIAEVQIEVFHQIAASPPSSIEGSPMLYACEV